LVILSKIQAFQCDRRGYVPVLSAFALLAYTLSALVGPDGHNQALAESALPTIKGPDDVPPLTTQRITNRLVGKIGVLKSQGATPRCTAFCLSHNLIATAGHCLRAHPDDPSARVTRLVFEKSVATAKDETRLGDQHTSQILGLVSGGTHISFRKPIDAQRDWAILRLRKPICTRGGLTLAPQIPYDKSARQHIELLAPRIFIKRRGRTMLSTHPCQIQKLRQHKNFATISADFSDASRLLFHNCDAGPFASGAPIIRNTARGLEVIAMHVGTYVRSRIFQQNRAIVERITSRPIANIAIPVEEFVRPITDPLPPRAPLSRSGRN